MITRLLISIVISIMAIFIIIFFVPPKIDLVQFYAENLRPALFTGFLTLGIFMLSLKTFIIIKMKESVYDNEKYFADFEKKKRINNDLKLYKPLQNLSNLLFIAVLSALITSVLQFTVGLINSVYAFYICIFMAAFTLSLVFMALIEIKQNLNSWFSLLDVED